MSPCDTSGISTARQISGFAGRYLGGLLALLLAGSTTPAVAGPIPTSRIVGVEGKQYREVDDAVTKFGQGQYDQALELLEVAATRHPELSPARVMLARLFLASNQVASARNEVEKVILAQPDDPEAYEVLGNLALNDRRITEAGMLYDKLGELVAKMPGASTRKQNLTIRAHAGRATVAEARRQWDIAKGHLQDWIKLDEKNYRPHLRLGQVLFQLNEPQQAYEEFQTAARLGAEQAPLPEIVMGRLYQMSGEDKKNQDKAAEWMKLAVAKSPENPNAQIGVAEWLWQTGKLEEARQHADKALELKADSVDAKLVRGLIARYLKDYAGAEKQLEAAYLLSPGNFGTSNQLALVLAEQGDEKKLQRAVELAELNARQYNTAEAAATLGLVYLKAGRVEEAERALQAAVSSGAVTGDTAYYLGQLFAHQKKDIDAKRWLRAALDTTAPFANRDAAQALFDQLSKKS